MISVDTLARCAADAATSVTDVRFRIGAALSFHKSVYIGVNSLITHPVQAHYNKLINPHRIFLHAEIDALLVSGFTGDRLVVVRLLRNGAWGLAKPCEACANALRGINVYYSVGLGRELRELG